MSTAASNPQPADRLINHEAVTVARREALDLDHPDPEVRRLAVATLRQALHRMELTDPAIGDYCPRLTHEEGGLSERYVGSSPDPSERVRAAVRLVQPDHLTPQGARIILQALDAAPAGHARKGRS